MFSSFSSSISVNVKIQYRNGFYYATMFMLLISIIILQYLDAKVKLAFVPFAIIMNIVSTTGFFVALLVLLERQELSYYALVTSPIFNNTYLFAKIFTVTGLALVEGLGLYLFSTTNYSGFLFVFIGIICLSLIYCLACYAIAIRYSNFNEIIFPLIGLIMLLSLNLFFQLFGYENPLLIIFPSYGAFQMLSKGVSASLTNNDFAIYSLQTLFWIVAIYIFSQKMFNDFIQNLEI